MDKYTALIEVFNIFEKKFTDEYPDGYLALEFTSARPQSEGMEVAIVYKDHTGLEKTIISFGIVENM